MSNSSLMPVPDAEIKRLDLLVAEHLVEARALDVEDLAADREDRLELRVARLLGAAAGAVALDDEQLGFFGVAGRAVGELARHERGFEQGLAPREVAGLTRGHARVRRLRGLADDRLRLGRVLLEPLRELLVRGPLDERADLGVPELRLRLPLELGVAQLHRDDRGEALTDVLAEEVLVLLLEDPLGAGVLVHDVREGLLEALFVHPTFGGGDVVRERVQALVEPGVPLQGDLDLATVVGVADVDDGREQRLLGCVQVRDEVDDPAVVPEHLLHRFRGAFVAEDDLEALVEERHLPQPLDQGLRAELDLLHDRRVRPERDRRARPGGITDALQRSDGFAAVDEGDLELAAVALDLELEPTRKRVHDRHAHAVQTTGDLVALAAELSARVQHREDDLRGRLVGIFGVGVDGNPAAVVDHPAPAVGQERDVDARRETGQGLVHGVVDDLVDEVVQTRGTGRADVHAGALAHRLKTLQNRYVFGAVRHTCDPFLQARRRRARTPRPGTQKPWSQGVFYVLTVYQKRALQRVLRGPVTTTRIEVTEPSPQRSFTRAKRSFDPYRSWVAHAGPSTAMTHSPSRTERTCACAAIAAPTMSRQPALSVSSTSGAGIPSSRPTDAIASRNGTGSSRRFTNGDVS